MLASSCWDEEKLDRRMDVYCIVRTKTVFTVREVPLDREVLSYNSPHYSIHRPNNAVQLVQAHDLTMLSMKRTDEKHK